MDDERVIELWITAPRGGTFGVSGYPMVVRRFADVVAAETREECAQYLRDAAARLAPEGKRTNQIDRHTAHVLACKGDELAAARAWCDVGEGGAEMTADEARQKLFSMMREDECHAKTLVNHYADQFESLRQKASKSRKDEFLRELDGRKEVCNRHESDEMIENKTWQHEDTGMMTTCAIRPGNRWHDVCVAPDREHEDLTGKPCADKQDSRLRKDEFLQELDGRKEDERPISMLDRDAIATASAMIRLCGALEPDARILGDVRAGDALEALKNLLESAEEQSHRVMMVQNKKLYADAMEFGRLALLLSNENEKLRAFASDVMKAWPDGGIEGDDLQEIAVKHGMLAPETLFEPCGEWCNCNAGVDVDGGEWERGVECFRRTALLTGEEA